MAWAILDTNVYIGHWERGLYTEMLRTVRKKFIVRHSMVVLSELRRAARTENAQSLIEELYRLAPVKWEPTVSDWWRAGRLIRQIGDREAWDKHKRRDFQNDALIALTARRHGAAVVTANRNDFELLKGETGVRIVVAAEGCGTG